MIPKSLLKQLYVFGSFENVPNGVKLSVKNRLEDERLTAIPGLKINGQVVDPGQITVQDNGNTYRADHIDAGNPVDFPIGKQLDFSAAIGNLEQGEHTLELSLHGAKFGEVSFDIGDRLDTSVQTRMKVPVNKADNYSEVAISDRQAFIRKHTNSALEHVTHYSIDPGDTRGNIENFTGVSQVPLGFAGPVRVNGEYAQGEFLIPLSTTEGTLVASYNRGMKALNLSGGVMASVVDVAMQRAPVFVFENAREGRDFVRWVQEHFDEIRREAEATTKTGELLNIDPYLSNHFVYLRFNFSTGDAAGQNMVGRATFAACNWILQRVTNIEKFFLESNFATDKKASRINIMRTRGHRVTAEAIIKREVLEQHLRIQPEVIDHHISVAGIGAYMSGANNNGAHSANAITAMFIATGQDVANVAESSAAILYSELTEAGDLRMSLTLPSLIVGTYGGGTGLPTQRECLEAMGCYGKDKVHKFAEIVAGVALAGELSLAAAIATQEWVPSHERYGRNR